MYSARRSHPLIISVSSLHLSSQLLAHVRSSIFVRPFFVSLYFGFLARSFTSFVSIFFFFFPPPSAFLVLFFFVCFYRSILICSILFSCVRTKGPKPLQARRATRPIRLGGRCRFIQLPGSTDIGISLQLYSYIDSI